MTDANTQPPFEPETLRRAIETFRIYSDPVAA